MTDADIDPNSVPLAQWLARLAEPQGAPGGGAVSAMLAATCAGLLEMVASYTPGDDRADAARTRLAAVRRAALAAAEEDGVHSTAFGAALAMEDGEARERSIRKSAVQAASSTLGIGELATSLTSEARLLARIGNPNVRADLLVAVSTLCAALDAAVITTVATLEVLGRHSDVGEDDQTLGAALRDGTDELEREHRQLTQFARSL